jgi:hypothetical protein
MAKFYLNTVWQLRVFTFISLAMGTVLSHLALAETHDPASVCDKTQYEAVVDEAGAALRALNANHKPVFQEKLRELKDKRGWTNDQFLKEAAPFVKDDQIDVFDTKSNALLAEISGRGDVEAAAKAPDCALLLELRAKLKVLVETQTQKWAYMFGKLAGEIAK